MSSARTGSARPIEVPNEMQVNKNGQNLANRHRRADRNEIEYDRFMKHEGLMPE
jgi:hypothetical protein